MLVGATGDVKEVDPESEDVRESANLGLPEGEVIPGRQAALSPDGTLLYASSIQTPGRNWAAFPTWEASRR